jgi:hypothetical protein
MIKFDVVAAVRKYNAADGTEKTVWHTVGAIHESSKGYLYMTLEPWFNPAGLPKINETDNRAYLSLFEPKGKGEAPASREVGSKGPQNAGKGHSQLPNDDIPF